MSPKFLPRMSPTRWLALFLWLTSLADVGVLVLCISQTVPRLSSPSLGEVWATVLEAFVCAIIAVLLWERSRYGWWAMAWFVIYSVLSGTVSVIVNPPVVGVELLLAGGYLYHGLVGAWLNTKAVRRDAFGEVGATKGSARPFKQFGKLVAVILATGLIEVMLTIF